jgi:hypothetical protein
VTYAVILVFWAGCLALFVVGWQRPSSAARIAGILPAVGILGTFVGIAMALGDLNLSNPDAFGELVQDMQVKFGTSIVALGLSVVLRLRGAWTDENNPPVGLADVSEQLTAMNAELSWYRAKVVSFQDDMLQAQREFHARVAEQGTHALVSALEKVVREFDERVHSQFGENLGRLEDATKNLLSWQEQHKAEVESLHQRLRAATGGLELLALASRKLGEQAATVQGLADVSTKVQELLAARLTDLAERSVEMRSINEKLAVQTPALGRQLATVLAEAEEAAAASRKAAEELSRLGAEVHAQQETLGATYRKALEDAGTQLTSDLKRSSKLHGEAIEGQIKQLDRALGEELTRSLQSLANQLAALSNQFVKDYTPLTERLRDLVTIAEQTRGASDA